MSEINDWYKALGVDNGGCIFKEQMRVDDNTCFDVETGVRLLFIVKKNHLATAKIRRYKLVG